MLFCAPGGMGMQRGRENFDASGAVTVRRFVWHKQTRRKDPELYRALCNCGERWEREREGGLKAHTHTHKHSYTYMMEWNENVTHTAHVGEYVCCRIGKFSPEPRLAKHSNGKWMGLFHCGVWEIQTTRLVVVVVMRQNVTSSRKASIGLCSTVSLQQNDSFGFDDHTEHSSIYHTHHSLLAVNRERDWDWEGGKTKKKGKLTLTFLEGDFRMGCFGSTTHGSCHARWRCMLMVAGFISFTLQTWPFLASGCGKRGWGKTSTLFQFFSACCSRVLLSFCMEFVRKAGVRIIMRAQHRWLFVLRSCVLFCILIGEY